MKVYLLELNFDLNKYEHLLIDNCSLSSSIILQYVFKIYHASSKMLFNKNGKPYLEDKEIFFNVSHSGKYVVCAVSDEEVGIDIEHKDASRIFKDCTDSTKKWVMYESYVKLLGEKIRIHDDKEKIDCLTFTCKIEDYDLSVAYWSEKLVQIVKVMEKDLEVLL